MGSLKAPKRERLSNRMCIVDGKRMTVPERNIMMKLDYINSGLTYAGIGEKYGMSTTAVAVIAKSENWFKQKKDFTARINAAAEDKYIEVYAGCGVEINMIYNNTWQKVIDLCNAALNDPTKYLVNKDGNLRYGAIQVLAEVIERAQKGQQFTTGFIGREASAKLELQRDMVLLRKKIAGEEDDDEVYEDSFMDALNDIASEVWGDETN